MPASVLEPSAPRRGRAGGLTAGVVRADPHTPTCFRLASSLVGMLRAASL